MTTIQPFIASRSVPRWDANKAAQRVQHWSRIALAAVKQSGARKPPAVEPVLSFKDVLAKSYPDSMRVMLWECEREISLRSLLADCPRRIVLIVGPEGGFTNEEASSRFQPRVSVCRAGQQDSAGRNRGDCRGCACGLRVWRARRLNRTGRRTVGAQHAVPLQMMSRAGYFSSPLWQREQHLPCVLSLSRSLSESASDFLKTSIPIPIAIAILVDGQAPSWQPQKQLLKTCHVAKSF